MRHLLVVVPFVLCATAVQAWNDQRDNKPVSELAAMKEQELAYEAYLVCQRGVIVMRIYKPKCCGRDERSKAYTIRREAAAYLSTIMSVAQQAHGGVAPEWLSGAHSALFGGDMSDCMQIMTKASPESGKNKKRARAGTTKSRPQPAVAP
jgi:hypothetical protein